VDNPLNNKLDKIQFVENQLKLIEYLSNAENTGYNYSINQFKYDEEFLLYYFTEYTRQVNNHNLILELRRSVESILLDANRLLNDGIFSNQELDQYLDRTSKPLFNIVYYFLFSSETKIDESRSIGKFIEYVAMLRDFFEDLEIGYINVGKEDIIKYNLDVSSLKQDKKLLIWMRDKYPEMVDLMYEEISVLKSMPVKLKLFWTGPYLVVLKLLIRIKVYDFRFGMEFEKKLIKELMIFFQSFLLSMKLLLKIF
jgi:hypothetical protein